MKQLLYAVILITVTVLAGNARALVESPTDCLRLSELNPESQKSACFVKTQGKPAEIHYQGSQLNLGPETVLSLETKNIQILSGSLFLDAREKTVVRTSFARVEVLGEAWFRHDLKKTLVRNVNAGDFKFTSMTDLAGVAGPSAMMSALPIGFEIWMSRLDQNQEAQKGVLRPLEVPRALVEMKSEFGPHFLTAPRIQDYIGKWKANSEIAGQAYKAVIERHLASIDQKKKDRQSRERVQEQGRAEMRKLFRQRNNMGESELPTQD